MTEKRCTKLVNNEGSLENLIKKELDKLPEWCKADGSLGTHEWVYIYEPYQENKFNQHSSHTTIWRWKHYRCRHCHAVSSDYTVNPNVRRVR